MSFFIVGLKRVGDTPVASLTRDGATPTALAQYIGGLPLAIAKAVGGTPKPYLNHLGGIIPIGSLLNYVSKDTLSISDTYISFTNEDVNAVKTFSVLSTRDWTAELIDPMGLFEISKTSGIGGIIGKVAISLISENEYSEDYSASIVIRCGGLRQTLRLISKGTGASRVYHGFEVVEGAFILLDDKEFKVINDSPATYTRLSYIESTGEQYFNLNYVVKEADTIEMLYFSTSNTNGEKMLFGASDGVTATSASISSTSGLIRFGSNADLTLARVYQRYKIILKKSSVVNGTASGAPVFSAMPNEPLYLFARNTNGVADSFGKHRCYYFRITDSDGNIVKNLRPVKRSDGVVGMLDEVDGTFYPSESGVGFVGGLEASIPEGYEVLDKLTFTKDKLFNTDLYINEKYTIETLMQTGAPVGTAKYMYGVLSSNNKTTCTAYLASNGTWRFGASYRTINTADADIHYLVQDINSVSKDRTRYNSNIPGGAFVTSYTLPIGGSISATGVYNKGFFGDIYYITIREGENTLLYWIPVRTADGVDGFWDCVSQKFIESM